MKHFDTEAFSRAVKQFRFVELGIDLREAAKRTKISAATLSRIENKKIPEIDTVLTVCHWLKVPITKFIKHGKREA